MPGNYVKAFTMPEGFPEILREFSKELLREKPDDVYKYAYELFMNKVEEELIKKETLLEEKATAEPA